MTDEPQAGTRLQTRAPVPPLCCSQLDSGLLELQLLNQLLEALTILREINGIRRSAYDRRASRFKIPCEFKRRLAAVLHDHALRLLFVDNLHDVFERQRLEVKSIRGVIVRRYGFRVAVDHYGLVPGFSQR